MSESSTVSELRQLVGASPDSQGVVGTRLERRRVFARLHERIFGSSSAVTVGRFRILERLGSGASGIVYAAHDPELDRRVALKVLPHAADDERLAVRAEAEAKALARLRHPNVVSVHEVGVHGRDRFIAMELVEGETLRAWMERSPGWRRVVDLFLEAGRGLVAAHAAGVIHRDFKPDNVLVEDGHARVVDFGFAQAPGPSWTELERRTVEGEGSSTETDAVAGTLAYMSPEAMHGRVDEAGDLFALCVSLYEALYGVRPFGGATAREVIASIEAGRFQAPVRSDRVPRWLGRMVARGLAADPAARWSSVAELVRALEQRRRRPRVTAMLAGAGGLLLGGLAVVAWGPEGPGRCDRVGEAIDQVWNDERRTAGERAFAATGLPYAADGWRRSAAALDDYAERWAAARHEACEATYVRGEHSDRDYERQLGCLDQQRVELGALVGAFEDADATTVDNAVSASLRLSPPSECRALAPADRDDDEPAIPEPLMRRLAAAEVSASTGHYREGLSDAIALAAEADEAGTLRLGAQAHLAVARLHDGLAEYDAAEGALEASIARAEQGGDDELRFDAQLMLISVLAQQNRVELAHQWITLSRATLERVGASDRLRAELWFVEGNVAQAEGRHADAELARRRTLELRRRFLDDDDPRLASTHYALGTTLGWTGQREEAYEHYLRALELREAALGEQHPLVAKGHDGVALALADLGRLAEAEQHHRRAIELGEATLGTSGELLGMWTTNLAICIANARGEREAEPYFRRAAERLEAALGPDHLKVGLSRLNLARVLLATERPAEALTELERAEAIFDAELRPDHPTRITLFANRAAAHLELGQADLALGQARRALELAQQGDERTKVGETGLLVARAHRARGELDEAAEALALALAAFESTESRPDEIIEVVAELARVHEEAGRVSEAAEAREREAELRAQIEASAG